MVPGNRLQHVHFAVRRGKGSYFSSYHNSYISFVYFIYNYTVCAEDVNGIQKRYALILLAPVITGQTPRKENHEKNLVYDHANCAGSLRRPFCATTDRADADSSGTVCLKDER